MDQPISANLDMSITQTTSTKNKMPQMRRSTTSVNPGISTNTRQSTTTTSSAGSSNTLFRNKSVLVVALNNTTTSSPRKKICHCLLKLGAISFDKYEEGMKLDFAIKVSGEFGGAFSGSRSKRQVSSSGKEQASLSQQHSTLLQGGIRNSSDLFEQASSSSMATSNTTALLIPDSAASQVSAAERRLEKKRAETNQQQMRQPIGRSFAKPHLVRSRSMISAAASLSSSSSPQNNSPSQQPIVEFLQKLSSNCGVQILSDKKFWSWVMARQPKILDDFVEEENGEDSVDPPFHHPQIQQVAPQKKTSATTRTTSRPAATTTTKIMSTARQKPCLAGERCKQTGDAAGMSAAEFNAMHKEAMNTQWCRVKLNCDAIPPELRATMQYHSSPTTTTSDCFAAHLNRLLKYRTSLDESHRVVSLWPLPAIKVVPLAPMERHRALYKSNNLANLDVFCEAEWLVLRHMRAPPARPPPPPAPTDPACPTLSPPKMPVGDDNQRGEEKQDDEDAPPPPLLEAEERAGEAGEVSKRKEETRKEDAQLENTNKTKENAKRNKENVAPARAARVRSQIQYCECCQLEFDNLAEHLVSEKHCEFAENEKNFQTLQDLPQLLPNFSEFLTRLSESARRSRSKTSRASTTPQSSSPAPSAVPQTPPAAHSANVAALHPRTPLMKAVQFCVPPPPTPHSCCVTAVTTAGLIRHSLTHSTVAIAQSPAASVQFASVFVCASRFTSTARKRKSAELVPHTHVHTQPHASNRHDCLEWECVCARECVEKRDRRSSSLKATPQSGERESASEAAAGEELEETEEQEICQEAAAERGAQRDSSLASGGVLRFVGCEEDSSNVLSGSFELNSSGRRSRTSVGGGKAAALSRQVRHAVQLVSSREVPLRAVALAGGAPPPAAAAAIPGQTEFEFALPGVLPPSSSSNFASTTRSHLHNNNNNPANDEKDDDENVAAGEDEQGNAEEYENQDDIISGREARPQRVCKELAASWIHWTRSSWQ